MISLLSHVFTTTRYGIDSFGRGAYMIEGDDKAVNTTCFYNPSRFGSVLYQRMRDYYGALYELQTGKLSQGYGTTYALPVFHERSAVSHDAL